MDIIGDVVVTPDAPQQAESVLIDVRAPDGSPIDEAKGPWVRIDGVTGPRQHVQFARAGTHTVLVLAMHNGQVQRKTVEIEVAPLAQLSITSPHDLTGLPRLREVRAAIAELPMLQLGRSINEPYNVAFSTGGFKVFKSGLANARPVHQKTLEPELNSRPSAPAGQRPEPTPAPGGDGVAGSPLPTRTVATSGDRLHLIPQASKLLSNRFDRIRGAVEVRDPIGAVILQPTEGSSDGPVYHWDFGDGSTATSFGPQIAHDYEPALDPGREHQSFDVVLRIEMPNGSVQEVRRTLSVFNAYAECKRRGAIVPKVEQQTFASTEGFGYSATLRVHNVESFPLTLTAQRLRIMSEDTDQLDVLTPLVAIDAVSVPAQGSTEIPVFVPFSQVPKRSRGFTTYFFGNAPDGTAIRVEATFDVRARDRSSGAITFGDIAVGRLPIIKDLLTRGTPFVSTHPGTATGASNLPPVVGELNAVRSVGGSNTAARLETDSMNERVLGNSLTHLERIAGPRSESWTDLLSAGREIPLALINALQPSEGSECDPDNLPDLSQEQLDEGWVCQSTSETREVVTPARFLNALKGDIILSPGGNGLIGGLLMQVAPPQRYSHSGIMTRNYDQVTHSTASEDRLLDHPNGSVFGQPAPTDGFIPNALKYLWPGAITQSVEEAVYGGDFVDPESGKTYRIHGFSPTPEGADVAGHWELIPPLVVKPDPLLETPEIRLKLRQIATDALAQTGNSHYRFYCYTDPSLGQRPEGAAPASAGWAAGTYPSVCSSFIWMTMKRQGSHLETANATVSPADLETLDVAAGAQVDAATPDGLYLYTAEERRAAAEWLRADLADRIARKLEEDTGILAGAIDFFSDMIDDVANQMLNTFASDSADTAAKDSEAWRQTVDANAVSPDNILLWDSPQAVGLYGYAAPMHFRPSRLEEIVVHRWRKVPTKGRLSGRVWFNGNPVGGALVQVYDGKSDFTDANGIYEITGIPFGNYTVKAWKDNVNGMMVSANVSMSLGQPTQSLDIILQPPADAYRRVQIQARIQTTDDESWPWDDEHADTAQFREVFIGPWRTHDEVYLEQRMGGEIRIELRFVVDLDFDRSAVINLNAKMYEGTSEDTNDLNDEENTTGFRVAKDQTRTGSLRLYNDEFNGGDISNIRFTITNLVQS